MTDDHKTDPPKLPALGRMMLWVDKPGSVSLIFRALAVVCVAAFLLDFTYEKHVYFDIEYIPGFYGIYGFVMFSGLVIMAKALRVLVKRPEDYYGDKAVDSEAYPDGQLEKVNHDGL